MLKGELNFGPGLESISILIDENDDYAIEGFRELASKAKEGIKSTAESLLKRWNDMVQRLIGKSKEIKSTNHGIELKIPKEKFSKMQELIKNIKSIFDMSTTASKIAFAADKKADELYELSSKISRTKTHYDDLIADIQSERTDMKTKVAAGAKMAAKYVKDTYITFPISTLLTFFADIIKCVTSFDYIVKKFKSKVDAISIKSAEIQYASGIRMTEDIAAINKKLATFTVIITYVIGVVFAFISIMQIGKVIKKVTNKVKAAVGATKEKVAGVGESVTTNDIIDTIMSDDELKAFETMEKVYLLEPSYAATEAFKVSAKDIIDRMKNSLNTLGESLQEKVGEMQAAFSKICGTLSGSKIGVNVKKAIMDALSFIEKFLSKKPKDYYEVPEPSTENWNKYIMSNESEYTIAQEAATIINIDQLRDKVKQVREEADKYEKNIDNIQTTSEEDLQAKFVKLREVLAQVAADSEKELAQSSKEIKKLNTDIEENNVVLKKRYSGVLKYVMTLITIITAYITIMHIVKRCSKKPQEA